TRFRDLDLRSNDILAPHARSTVSDWNSHVGVSLIRLEGPRTCGVLWTATTGDRWSEAVPRQPTNLIMRGHHLSRSERSIQCYGGRLRCRRRSKGLRVCVRKRGCSPRVRARWSRCPTTRPTWWQGHTWSARPTCDLFRDLCRDPLLGAAE